VSACQPRVDCCVWARQHVCVCCPWQARRLVASADPQMGTSRDGALALGAAAAGAAVALACRGSAAPPPPPPAVEQTRSVGQPAANIMSIASDPSVESTPAQRAALAKLRDAAVSSEATAAARSDFVEVTVEPLDVNAVVRQVIAPGAGGVSVFIGTTRDNFNGKTVTRLEYEAFESMAVKEMRKVCAAMRSRWTTNGGLVKVAMVHRVGVCPVEEPSVIVACSSGHRLECLEAAAFGIDSLKATVPVRKRKLVPVHFNQFSLLKPSVWPRQAPR
jgi:molybdopterin synthase catalytic subunit